MESVKATPTASPGQTHRRTTHCLSLWTTRPRWLAFPDNAHSSQLLSLAPFPVYSLPEDVTRGTNCRLDLSLPFFPDRDFHLTSRQCGFPLLPSRQVRFQFPGPTSVFSLHESRYSRRYIQNQDSNGDNNRIYFTPKKVYIVYAHPSPS